MAKVLIITYTKSLETVINLYLCGLYVNAKMQKYICI